MAQDFDKVTVSADGKELISLDPHIGADFGTVVGGRVICRDKYGNHGVVLIGGEEEQHEALAGGSINIRNGSLHLVNSQGQSRAVIYTGDVLENEDGGTIVLNSHSQQPGTSTIVFNASKRSLVINGSDGNPLVELGRGGNLVLGGSNKDGDIVLRDKSGKERVTLGGDDQRLEIVASDGTTVVTLGKNGNLVLGGGNQDGDFTLRSGSKDRITMGADGMKLVIQNDNKDKLVEIGGSNGDISINGNISAKGTLKHHGISERNRSVKLNQHYDLFPVNEEGAFTIRLVAAVGTVSDKPKVWHLHKSWSVFIHKADNQLTIHTSDIVDDILWENLEVSAVGNNVRLSIGPLGKVSTHPLVLRNGMLSVTAYWGSLLNF